MAKAKNKRKNLSENVNNKKESKNVKKLNPFEVHINKEKIKVLGRKLKNDKGLPGVSRAKAIQKRKLTLQEEYKVQNKSNKFTDRRIGERHNDMNEEDRVTARFTAERVKSHNRKSIFNLADDEILTHRGQTLSEIEKFDDPKSDDEESLDGAQTGNLQSKFVADAHFGGGLLKKTGIEGAKSHKDLIDQLIAESKKRKAEKQKTKEETQELTEKLDTEWRDLLPLVNKSKKEPEAPQQPQIDDYDKVMRELKFEARGTPSDRLKSEDEIAKEEKEKLEKLEVDRVQRMKGFIEDKTAKKNHKSADDLDDDFVYDVDPDVTLSYDKEGVSNLQLEAELNGKTIIGQNINEESGSENDEAEDDQETEEEQSSYEVETDSEDNLSDLKEESSDSDDEEQKLENNLSEEEATAVQLKRKLNDEEEAYNKKIRVEAENEIRNSEEQEKFKISLQIRKEMMEKAREELPYTYTLPKTYEELQKVLQNQSSHHQSIIIERMIKCNHPSLAAENKETLGMLFAFLLQHLNDIASDSLTKESLIKCFEIFGNLVPQMFDLAQLNKVSAHNCILEVIKEKQEEFRKNMKTYPGVEVLLYLKLISCLFPTSDFRHSVVTPCIVFIEQMLNKCRIKSKSDVAYGLFLTTLILEYTVLSKRFLPLAINFLAGIVHMAIPKTGIQLIKILPPFKPTSALLVLRKTNKTELTNWKLNCTDLVKEDVDEEFKIRVLYAAVKMLTEFSDNFKELPSNVEVSEPITKLLRLIPSKNYPERIAVTIALLNKKLEDVIVERKLEFIVMEKKKPKALRLYEPIIEKVYDGKKHKVQSREKAEHDKLLHKLKREKKGALREIRRDQAFLGRLKVQQRVQSDMERKERVKKIYAEASIQQSELNTLSRKNQKHN